MHVLHLGLGLHIRFPSITYGLFQNGLHASIASRPRSSPKLHIGYFETTLKMGITFKGFHIRFYLNHLWVISK